MVESSDCLNDDPAKVTSGEDVYPAGSNIMPKLPHQTEAPGRIIPSTTPEPSDQEEYETTHPGNLFGMSEEAIENMDDETRELLAVPYDQIGSQDWSEKMTAHVAARKRRERMEKAVAATVAVGGLAGAYLQFRDQIKSWINKRH
ncbi:MAG TPA: hypothetical protein VG604_00520 [Candidatus Saccharimonadales bacterium]|nr:hypothetical protein [Candidatus Saccharimonadales bacterium]